MTRPADPSVSPADTIRRAYSTVAEVLVLTEGYLNDGYGEADLRERLAKARPALDVLLAVGERDKAEIERLRKELGCSLGCKLPAGHPGDHDFDPDWPYEVTLRQEREAGERDRRQIAQLTGALTKATWHLANYTFRGKDTSLGEEAARLFDEYLSAAVLADEEDAGNG